jgi:hypothetical protein
MLVGFNPRGALREIDKVSTVDELVTRHAKMGHVLEMLLRLGGQDSTILALINEFNDWLTIKHQAPGVHRRGGGERGSGPVAGAISFDGPGQRGPARATTAHRSGQSPDRCVRLGERERGINDWF